MALLDHERRHDALTGLPNRTRFLHELESLTEASADVVLAVADVDGFGAVNDLFGSKRGDSVLCEVAARPLPIAGPGRPVGGPGADHLPAASTAHETPPRPGGRSNAR